MDLELLRTFLEVNRSRNFGRAGETLFVTQAAVSARIKQLEGLLGVKLFVRQYHDLQLTPEGHRLVRHADIMLAGWRKARQEVAMGDALQQLTVGGSLRLWDVALQDWFHNVRRGMPDLAIIAESHTPDLLTRRMLDGHLDLAFMLEPAQLDLLQIKKVGEIDLAMVSNVRAQSLEQALGQDYIMVDWGLAHGLQHRRMYPDAPEPRLRVSQAKMALAHMLALGGSAYLPKRMIAAELEQGILWPVAGATEINTSAFAVYPIRSPKEVLIKQVLEYFEYRVEVSPADLTHPDHQ